MYYIQNSKYFILIMNYYSYSMKKNFEKIFTTSQDINFISANRLAWFDHLLHTLDFKIYSAS